MIRVRLYPAYAVDGCASSGIMKDDEQLAPHRPGTVMTTALPTRRQLLPPHRSRRLAGGLFVAWLLLLGLVCTAPYFTASPTRADDLTRNTVRVALVYYALALSLLLVLRPAEWAATSAKGWLARWCWTLAWAVYLVHLGM